MKKLTFMIVGALLLAGCQSTPQPAVTAEKPKAEKAAATPAETKDRATPETAAAAKDKDKDTDTTTIVRFRKGESGAEYEETVGKNGKKDYIVGASKGQLLTASVRSECAGVTLEVIDQGPGQTLTEGAVTKYQDELPGTGDYIIRVRNSDGTACKFTLKVGIE